MRRLIWSRLAKAISRDNGGVSTVEFALVAPPLLIMIFGGLDLAHQSYVRSVLTGALTDSARRAAVQKPDFVQLGGTTEERVVAAIKAQMKPVAPNATYVITVSNFEDFTGINKSEKLMVDTDGDGQYDASQHDCFEDLDSDGQFDLNAGRTGVGSASDVVYYKATVTLPHLFPWTAFLGGPKNYSLTAESVMRNQPYAVNVSPPVICG